MNAGSLLAFMVHILRPDIVVSVCLHAKLGGGGVLSSWDSGANHISSIIFFEDQIALFFTSYSAILLWSKLLLLTSQQVNVMEAWHQSFPTCRSLRNKTSGMLDSFVLLILCILLSPIPDQLLLKSIPSLSWLLAA